MDDAELDAALLEQVTPHLPASLQQARRDPRLHLRVEGPRRFLARPAAYDLVLLGMPEPESGRTNRYYTREFFALCARRMQPAGVLALRLGGAENLWTPQTLRRLASVERALRTEFADVVVLPGATNLLLASRAPLDRAPSLLSARLDRRGVGSALVRPPYVRYLYTNDRFDEIMALLHDTAVPANADAPDLCSAHDGGERLLDHTCIHAGDYGTRSSTLLRRGPRREADVFRFASGAPCAASYEDLTPLLRALD